MTQMNLPFPFGYRVIFSIFLSKKERDLRTLHLESGNLSKKISTYYSDILLPCKPLRATARFTR